MKRFEYDVVIDRLDTGGVVAQTTLHSVTAHHSAVRSNVAGYNAEQRIKSYTAWARQKGNKGMQYQFMIPYDESDLIYVTNYTSGHVWHNSNYEANQDSLSILIDGNFEVEKPSAKQLQKLEQLLRDLQGNWFTTNGWFSFEKGIVPADKNAIRTYSEGIKVPSLHYHNEVAQAGHGTACAGKYLIPFIIDYRAKGGKVTWGVPVDPPVETCEQKLAKEISAHTKTKATLNEVQEELKLEKAKIEVLEIQMKKMSEDCEKEKADLQTKIDEQRIQLKTLADKNDELKEENNELKKQNIELSKSLEDCKEGNTGCLPFSNFFKKPNADSESSESDSTEKQE